ncbi:MAG: SAM-dependent methyltransferase [Paraglaciecola sp.]|jgi:SAM-dependent methyltransferase
MESSIYQYYEKLAKQYDENRFGNSYGRFIHQQEKRILKPLLEHKNGQILDLGCGTGRLVEFATHGTDLSPKMIAEAKKKHPEKNIKIGNATQIDFPNAHFSTVFSMHVFMHLPLPKLKQISHQVYDKLDKCGSFIFDFPSQKRRNLTNYQSKNWHGGTAYTISELEQLLGEKWILKSVHGLLFLPIHRFPTFIRKLFLPLDNCLCRSFLQEYSSYLIVKFVKK